MVTTTNDRLYNQIEILYSLLQTNTVYSVHTLYKTLSENQLENFSSVTESLTLLDNIMGHIVYHKSNTNHFTNSTKGLILNIYIVLHDLIVFINNSLYHYRNKFTFDVTSSGAQYLHISRNVGSSLYTELRDLYQTRWIECNYLVFDILLHEVVSKNF